MNPNEIVSMIGSVGFPIVMCFALFGFVQKEIRKLIETVDNNSKVMTALLHKMDGGLKHEE